MHASPEEVRLVNLTVKIAYGLQGTKRPEWFLDELLEDLMDSVWLQPKVREDTFPRMRFLLRKFSQMEGQPRFVQIRGRTSKQIS